MASSLTSNLAKFGLAGVALGSVLSITITTLTATTSNLTTANITTANVQTLSGAVISATDPGDVIEGHVLSGNTLVVKSTAAVRGTLSGASTLTLSLLGPRINQMVCVKAGGVLGYVAITATGTIAQPFTCN